MAVELFSLQIRVWGTTYLLILLNSVALSRQPDKTQKHYL